MLAYADALGYISMCMPDCVEIETISMQKD